MDANKRKKSRGVRTIQTMVNTFSYILMILGISLLVSAFGILVANDMFALVKEDQAVLLILEEEKSVKELAGILEDNDIISFGWAFRLFAGLKKIESFDQGSFQVDAGMDYGQIIGTLNKSVVARQTVTITIPEGYTLKQIAQLMADQDVCAYEDFMETANTYDYSHKILQEVPMVENRLEGYLFPDTYQFYTNDDPVYVINKMINNFVNKYTPEMRNLTDSRGMTMRDIIIIASMIEREAKVNAERTTISGVIYNRLNRPDRFPYLQIDATILYVTGHKEIVTDADTEINSPYNTYTSQGLPPTAICNPGLSSILAAISPEKHDYYYYVVDVFATDEDGEMIGAHVFSKNLDEHNRNVNRMRQGS